jgi:hypothetical protein
MKASWEGENIMSIDPTVMTINRNVFEALNMLMKACGLSDESDTEELYEILSDIIFETDREIRKTVKQSHKDGLCYDVNALLAGSIADAVVQRASFDKEKTS